MLMVLDTTPARRLASVCTTELAELLGVLTVVLPPNPR